MPTISNIRIVNLSYGKRRIADESFYLFHDGESQNALLNLENGGGKSVLVQFMLQPIVPKASINKRKVERYFTKTSEPAFIMLEMKLDNPNDFITIGIALCPGESVDEKNRGIKFFTFISQYKRGAGQVPYSIDNLKFSQRDGKKISFSSYKEAMSYIKQLENKHYQVKYFHQDEVSDYYTELERFGISHNEWEKVMVAINNQEGGVTEFFENFNTTNKLLNGLLIDTIDKSSKLGEKDENGEDNSLSTMMINYVKKLVENDESLAKRKQMNSFLSELENCKEPTKKLWDLSDKYTEAILELHKFVEALKGEREKKKNLRLVEEEEEKVCGKRIRDIQVEEWSHEYWRAQDAFEKAEIKIGALNDDIRKLTEEIEEKERKLNLQSAAKTWEKQLSEERRSQIISEDIESAERQGGSSEKLAALRFGIGKKSKEERKEAQECQEELEELYDEETKNLRICIQDEREVKNAAEDGQKELNSLQGKLLSFKDRTEKMLKELDLQLIPTMLNEYDEGDLRETEQGLSRELAQADEKVNIAGNSIRDNNRRIEDLEREKRDLTINLNKLEGVLEKLQESLKIYRSAEEEMDRALTNCEINLKNRFTKGMDEGLLETRANLREEIKEKEKQGLIYREQKESAEKGSLHISPRLLEHLDEMDIAYITGENWFKDNREDGVAEKALEMFPALPYSIILIQQKNVERVIESSEELWLPSLGCIITYNQLNEVLQGRTRKLAAGEGVSLLSCYERKALYSKEEYLKDLEQSIEKNTEVLAYKKESLASLEADIKVIQSFDYEADYEKKLHSHLEAAEDEIGTIQLRLEGISPMPRTIREENDTLDVEKTKRIEERIYLEGKLRQFEQWRKELQSHYKNLSDESQIQEELEELNSKKIYLEEKNKEINEKLQLMHSEMSMLVEQIDKYKSYEAQFESYGETDISALEGKKVDELQDELRQTEKALTMSLEEKRQSLRECMKEISECKKEIDSYGFKDEYKDIRFDEGLRDQLRQSIPRLRGDKDRLQDDIRPFIEEKARTETQKTNWQLKIRQYSSELMGKESIRGDFSKRIKELEERKKIILGRIIELEKTEKILEEQNRGGAFLRERYPYLGKGEIGTGTVGENPAEELKIIGQTIQDCEKEKEETLEKYRGLMDRIHGEYQSYGNVFSATTQYLKDQLFHMGQQDYGRYYTIYEAIENYVVKVKELIGVFTLQLEELDSYKKHFVSHCFIQGRRIYEELDKLSKGSSVKLPGMAKRIKMLVIEFPKDLKEEFSYQRIESYILAETEALAIKVKENIDEREIYKKVAQAINSRQLLNKYIGKENIMVRAYKIDASIQNSEYRNWEDAITDNSGGEKFVVFFAVILSLMYYTRNNGGEGASELSSTLIMDNPFGPISSEHLLKPMFTIAERFKVQLICLSQFDTVDIVNCFKLVYKIKIRQLAYSNYEIVEFENCEGAEEILEHGYYKGTQMSLI